MPYTPPAQRSPAASTTPTPTLSRRSSYQPGPPLRSADPHRPELPRSASYLTRQQRRTAAAANAAAPRPALHEPSPPPSADHDQPALHLVTHNGSVRQSPPPRSDDSQVPPGAVLSPPDSAQNSSDDEDSRALQMTNLVQLQEAIRVLAERDAEAARKGPVQEVERAVATALETTDPASRRASVAEITAALPREVRRQISHHRARTETYLDRSVTPVFAQTPSDEESLSDEDTRALMRRPPMLRKKSGELVRPALRPSSARRRPSSMPGTPTFGKAVHFDSHLEHVRHFLQVDRPLAVSAGSSPVEAYEGETEFPFDDAPRGPPFEWELVLAHFPAETTARRAQPVHVERVYLSADNKTLIGAVAVANLAFHKLVVARFTLDYWKTTSEVVAEYAHDLRHAPRADGRDRFQFHIKLADLANLEAKTMFFCVKYVVDGREHWDNNQGTNYQVDFRKKALPQHGKRGLQAAASARPVSGLPRSHKKAPAPAGRPRAGAADAFDDFATGFDLKDPPPPLNQLLGESGPTLRLKGVRSAVNLPVSQAPHPTGQAFGTRYDFGASMAAAINASHALLGDKSGITMKMPVGPVRGASRVVDADDTTSPLTIRPTATFPAHAAPRMFTPAPSLGPAGPEKPGLASQSYHELLDKYCFYGTKNASPQMRDGTLKPTQLDGTTDFPMSESVASSTSNSPITMAAPSKRAVVVAPAVAPSRPGRTSPAPVSGYASAIHG